MSTWYSHELVCPACAATFPEMLAAGIHAKRIPHVRDKILRGELHHVTCPACRTEIDVHSELVYTDFHRRQWIELGVPEQRLHWQRIETEALARFDRAMTRTAPAMRSLAPEFLVRVVFDLDEARERIQIWEAGLDDGIVECLKLQSVRERPSLVGDELRIRVRSVEASGSVGMASVYAGAPTQPLATWIVPAEVVRATVADAEAWRAQCPELFRPGFVSLDRYFVSGGENRTQV